MAGLLGGKVAIVTGASRGIGRACAVELARAGASVVVAARDASALDDVAAEVNANGGEVVAFPCDVTERAQVDALVAETVSRFGGVHVLVNAAQTPVPDGRTEEYPLELVERSLRSGVYGTLNVMQAAFVHLRAAGDASVVNFGDPDAVVGEPGKVANNIAKEGIRALSRTTAREWGRFGIRVNVVCPTVVSERVAAQLEEAPDLKAWIESQIPSGVIGEPREVARTVVFLASSDSAMLTGMTVEVDGGRNMYA